MPTTSPAPGCSEHDAQTLWDATVAAIGDATMQVVGKGRIEGIACASIGEAGVLLDRDRKNDGAALAPILAWHDPRPQSDADWLRDTLGEAELFNATGLKVDRMFGLAKWRWYQRTYPDAVRRASHWLHVADYLAFRLGARPATDYTLASRTLALDLREGAWRKDFVEAAGFPPRLLPELVESGTSLGCVSGLAAEQTGLPVGCAIAAGGHDHVIGAFAAGAWQPGTVLDSLGTAEALLSATTAPCFDAVFAEQGYSQGAMRVAGPSELAKFYAVGAMTTSGACTQWFKDKLGPDTTHAELAAQASRVPPGCEGARFFPHMRTGAPPHPDPQARGAFFGLTPDMSRAAMYRAVLEGIALDAREVLAGQLSVLRRPWPDSINVIGGNTRNELLLEIKAAVMNCPLDVLELSEATSLGAALMGGLAAGVYADADEALESVSPTVRRVMPNPELVEAYSEVALARR